MSSHGNKSFLGSSLIQKMWIGKKLREKEGKEEDKKWKNLPDEVMELIMKRLSLKDYLALRKICSPWRSIVINAISNKHCLPLPEFPLVVLRSIKERSKEQTFFSIRTEHEHCQKRSLFKSSKMSSYHGSVGGWMIMMDCVEKDNLSFFFFNPVTNRRVSVPSQLYYPSNSQVQDNKLLIGKMVASSTPDCRKSDCFLAGLFHDYCHIAFYRHLDKSWNMIETEKDSDVYFQDVEIMGSKLYVITERSLNSMLVYDLKDSSNGSPKPKVLAMLPENSTLYAPRIIDNPLDVSSCIVLRCLAKHETLEQLFLIYTICNVIYKRGQLNNLSSFKEFVIPPEIAAVEVFKWDMNEEPIEWIKCERLDDNVIFVGLWNSMVMSRASLNRNQESIRVNSVYFALSFNCRMNSWKGVRLGIIHLNDNNVKYFSVKKSNHSKVPVLFWFRPSV